MLPAATARIRRYEREWSAVLLFCIKNAKIGKNDKCEVATLHVSGKNTQSVLLGIWYENQYQYALIVI